METGREPAGSAAAVVTRPASHSLREVLAAEGLALAQPADLRPFRFVLRCRVCGEATEVQPFNAVPCQCYQCGLTWQQTAPIFHVLMPKEMP